MIRRWTKAALDAVPTSLAARIGGGGLICPFYHSVRDEPVAHTRHLFRACTVKEFEQDLDLFTRYYRPIGLDELPREEEACRERVMLLSFDDGLREMHDVVAPILERRGIPAVFFLCPRFLDNEVLFYRCKASLLVEAAERSESLQRRLWSELEAAGMRAGSWREAILAVGYARRDLLDYLGEVAGLDFSEYARREKPFLTSAQVRRLLAAGFRIGSHSLDHPRYSELSGEEQIEQTVRSAKELSARFETVCDSFAFPHGDARVAEGFYDAIEPEVRLSFLGHPQAGLSDRRVVGRTGLEAEASEAEHRRARIGVRFVRKTRRFEAVIGRGG